MIEDISGNLWLARRCAKCGRYHPGLHETNARVEVLLCHAAEGSDTPAVTLRGRKCYAVVSILNLKSRVAGRGDAEIVVDGDNWQSWGPAKLAAILDHELTHLELKRTSGGESWKTDDAGRPKMTLRQHDIEVGWFDCVARRHGLHSSSRPALSEATGNDHTTNHAGRVGLFGDWRDPRAQASDRRLRRMHGRVRSDRAGELGRC